MSHNNNYLKVMTRLKTHDSAPGKLVHAQYVFFDDNSIMEVVIAKEKAGKILMAIRGSGLEPVLSVARPVRGLTLDLGFGVVSCVGENPSGSEEGSG